MRWIFLLIPVVAGMMGYFLGQRAKAKRQVKQFKAWAVRLPDVSPEFKVWLADLAPKQVETLIKRMFRFGAKFDVKLARLLEAVSDDDTGIARDVEAPWALYCQAYWKAAHVQSDVNAFEAFLTWQKAPTRKKNQELGEQLFVRLVEAELAFVPSGLYFVSDKRRTEHIVQTIRQVAREDWPTLNALLKQVLAAAR